MKIEISCAMCGRNRFNLSTAQRGTSIIICEDCGHNLGTLRELEQRVADEVLRRTSPKDTIGAMNGLSRSQ